MPELIEFVHETGFAALPDDVVAQARRCVLDLLGVAAAGARTTLSRIVSNHAARFHASAADAPLARILFDGRPASPAGAAYAGAAAIDSFDAHDGHALTKGHAGVAVLPAALALPQGAGASLLADVAIGYEVAVRAGIALHATACDYHTSGAWNALACAALGARRLRLSASATRHALGIAEFHGPRSQMMRCIDHPTMLKDGSGWGALAGVEAAFLAADGFTGAPAVTVEGADVAHLWRDLGTRWRILELYFKPHPVCRWAQPAVEAALALRRQLGCAARDLARIEVTTFREAARLAVRRPETTEEAQYSLPYSVAAAVARNALAADEIEASSFADSEILRLSDGLEVKEAEEYNARFPAERWAEVTFVMADGAARRSGPFTARGDPETPLDQAELAAKFRALAGRALGLERAARLQAWVERLADRSSRPPDDLFAPAPPED